MPGSSLAPEDDGVSETAAGAGSAATKAAVPFEHVQRWGRACIVVLALFVPLMVFTYEDLSANLTTLEFVDADLPVSDNEILLNHARLGNVSTAAVVLGILGAILWLVWQYRAHRNVAAVAARKPRFGAVAGAGSWFIPIANVLLPPLAIADLWRATDMHDSGRQARWWRRVNPLIGAWWVAFVASVALVARASALALRASTPDELVARDHAFQLAVLVVIPAAVAAAILIAVLDRRLMVAENAPAFRDWQGWTTRRGEPPG